MRISVYRISDKKLEKGLLVEESTVEGAITLTWVVIDSKKRRTRCAVGSWGSSPLKAWEKYVDQLTAGLQQQRLALHNHIELYAQAKVDHACAVAELYFIKKNETDKNN